MFGINDFNAPIIDFSNFTLSSLGTAFLFGISILLIGMVTIFAVLAILWLFLLFFKYAFHDLAQKKAAKEALTTIVTEKQDSDSKEIEDGEIVAVIAAAIAAAENDYSDSKFRVVSFRRT